MAYNISLKLPKGWTAEQSIETDEEGIEVSCLWASGSQSEDAEVNAGTIELYVGDTPEGSDAKIECINNYIEVLGADDEDEEIPVQEIDFMGTTGWFYEAQDDAENPVCLLCAEPRPGILVLGIFSHEDEEKLAGLIEHVSDNLKVD